MWYTDDTVWDARTVEDLQRLLTNMNTTYNSYCKAHHQTL